MGLVSSKNQNVIENELLFLQQFPNYKKKVSFDFKIQQKESKNVNQENEGLQQINEDCSQEQQQSEIENKDQIQKENQENLQKLNTNYINGNIENEETIAKNNLLEKLDTLENYHQYQSEINQHSTMQILNKDLNITQFQSEINTMNNKSNNCIETSKVKNDENIMSQSMFVINSKQQSQNQQNYSAKDKENIELEQTKNSLLQQNHKSNRKSSQTILETHLDDLKSQNKELFQSLVFSERELQKQIYNQKEKKSIYNISQYNPTTKQHEFKQLSTFDKEWLANDPHASFVIEKKQIYQEKKENQVKNVINEFVNYSIGKVIQFKMPTDLFSSQKPAPSYGRISIVGLTIKQKHKKSDFNNSINSSRRGSLLTNNQVINNIKNVNQQQNENDLIKDKQTSENYDKQTNIYNEENLEKVQEESCLQQQQQQQKQQPLLLQVQEVSEDLSQSIKQPSQEKLVTENITRSNQTEKIKEIEQCQQIEEIQKQQQQEQQNQIQNQQQQSQQINENLKQSQSSQESEGEQVNLSEFLINMGSQLIIDLYAQTNENLFDFEEISNEQQSSHKLKVYLKSYTQEKFKINIFRSSFIVPCPAKFFVDFLNNEDEQKLLDNNMSEFYSIEKFHNDFKLIYLAYKKVLIISARDFVYLKHFKQISKEEFNGNDCKYRQIWIDASKSITHERFEPLKGKVRGEIIMSGYSIKEYEENNQVFCQVSGYSEINFKMNIPVSMTKSISKKEMKLYIEKSIERIQELQKQQQSI